MNAILPGRIRTERTLSLDKAAGEQASYITGSAIAVDGGMIRQM